MVTQLNERFVLAEDEALKRKLEGLKVTYPREQAVDVWFRWPNKEIREVRRPFISIDLADVVKADHREHQGLPFELGYQPYGYEPTIDPETGASLAREWPTPYDLIYSITTATADPRHDRQLLGQLLGVRGLAPHRWGYLEIPEDGTVRRLETISVTDTTGRDANNDIEYRRTFTVRVESELFTAEIDEVQRVLEVGLWIHETTSGLREEF